MMHSRPIRWAALAASLLLATVTTAPATGDIAWAATKRRPAAETKKSSKKKSPKRSLARTKDKTRKTEKSSAKARVDSISGGKLARPGSKDDAPNPPAPAAGETAFRSIGIGVFAADVGAPEGFSEGAATRFCEEIAKDLSQKSYFLASCLKQRTTGGETAKGLAELARKRDVDAILLGTVSGAGVSMKLVSGRSGRVIGTFTGESAKKFDKDDRAKMVASAVDGLVAKIPFRGFIVRSMPDDSVEVNLGSSHGLIKGTMLKVFEFAGENPNMGSGQSVVGVVEITDVLGPDLSKGRIVDRRGPVGAFSKISHEAAEPPSQAAIARVTTEDSSFWVSIGPEILTVDSTIKGIAHLNREYKIKATPFMQIAMGGDRWFTNFWYGSAADDVETLSYFALQGAYQLRSLGGFKSGYTVSGGAWISQYSASAKRLSSARVLEDSTRYSPFLEVRYQKVVGSRWMLFISGEGQYPLIATGQQSGQIPFSYGIGSTPGVRFNMNEWLSLEAGYRYQYLTLPLAGDKGTAETHNGYFLRGVFLL